MSKRAKKVLTKDQLQVLSEAMKGKEKKEVMGIIGKSRSVTERKLCESEAKVYWNAREQRRQAELERLLHELQMMIEKEPETKFKWGDKIMAGKLKAELEGHLKTHSEEKHVHFHGNDLSQLGEGELRKELARMEKEKLLEGSNVGGGTPTIVVDAL